MTNYVVISGNDFLSVTFNEEINFKFTTGCDVGKSSVLSSFVGDDWRLGVGVSEEDTHPFVFLLGLDQSKWVNTVGLESTGSVIVRSGSTVTPHGPCSWSEREFSGSFSKTIDSLGVYLQIKLHKFIGHDEIRIMCVDIDNVRLSGTSELESKWLICMIKTCHIG
jgi:hypothetical protein